MFTVLFLARSAEGVHVLWWDVSDIELDCGYLLHNLFIFFVGLFLGDWLLSFSQPFFFSWDRFILLRFISYSRLFYFHAIARFWCLIQFFKVLFKMLRGQVHLAWFLGSRSHRLCFKLLTLRYLGLILLLFSFIIVRTFSFLSTTQNRAPFWNWRRLECLFQIKCFLILRLIWISNLFNLLSVSGDQSLCFSMSLLDRIRSDHWILLLLIW